MPTSYTPTCRQHQLDVVGPLPIAPHGEPAGTRRVARNEHGSKLAVQTHGGTLLQFRVTGSDTDGGPFAYRGLTPPAKAVVAAGKRFSRRGGPSFVRQSDAVAGV
jgi:hypothetical protein